MKILAISTQHDSGAAVVVDGRILAAVNEERLSRRKFHTGWPELSIAEVLRLTNISRFDRVVLSSYVEVDESTWDWPEDPSPRERLQEWPREAVTLLSRAKLAGPTFGKSRFSTFAAKVLGGYRQVDRDRRAKNALTQYGIDAPIEIVEHHPGHAYGAWLTSPWKECLVLTLDAQGDGLSSVAARAGKDGLKIFNRISFLHTPAHQYAYATRVLGYRCGREGKTTGLAAYGNAAKTIDIFRSRITYSSKKRSFIDTGYYIQPEIAWLREALKDHTPEDIAAGVQEHLEEIVVPWVKDMALDSGLRLPCPVALSGGVFANVKLNQRIAAMNEISEIFIHPHMGDGGLAVGSALAVEQRESKLEPRALHNVYLGASYDEREIESAIKEFPGMKLERPANLPLAIAELIAKNKVVGLFSGRMEYGPRALGARSVIYHAKDKSVNDWLNKRMSRTEFMPFAPVVREEDLEKYFRNTESGKVAAQFMTVTFDATAACKNEAPAVVHVDGTARPQTIRRDQHQLYYDIISRYGELTGSPILINTSFNMHEEPIVATPRDALRTYDIDAVDVLVLDPFIVVKTAR